MLNCFFLILIYSSKFIPGSDIWSSYLVMPLWPVSSLLLLWIMLKAVTQTKTSSLFLIKPKLSFPCRKHGQFVTKRSHLGGPAGKTMLGTCYLMHLFFCFVLVKFLKWVYILFVLRTCKSCLLPSLQVLPAGVDSIKWSDLSSNENPDISCMMSDNTAHLIW